MVLIQFMHDLFSVSGDMYKPVGIDPDEKHPTQYTYYINMCGPLGYSCGTHDQAAQSSVCQRIDGKANFMKNCGDANYMDLR